MNGDSFDRFSRQLGASISRRGVLKAFAAGVAAAIVASLGPKSTPTTEAIDSPYPTAFLKGMCYEAFPYNYTPSTANAPAANDNTCGASGDGTGVQLFFGTDACRRESAPMWGTSFSLKSGTQVKGRNDVGAMQQMGVTLIRPYDWDARNDHSQFLDYCQSKGIKVLAAVSNYYLLDGFNITRDADYNTLVKSFGNAAKTDYHPAIVGIIVGNEPEISGYTYTQAATVTRRFTAAEARVFPNGRRPMIGHPVDFGTYGGQYPCWGFWDPLLPLLDSATKARLFLAPQSYNDANYLFTTVGGTNPGYVQLTYSKYNLPLLFTEIGQSRYQPNVDAPNVVLQQLQGAAQYAANPQNAGQLLGVAFFEFGDKVWKCRTPNGCTDTEGGFGAWSHSNQVFQTVPYVCNSKTCDFVPYHYDYCGSCSNPGNCSGTCGHACPNQSVTFDVMTTSTLYTPVVTAYSGGTNCGGANQPCCGGANGTCDSGLACKSGTCVACGTQNQPCCAGSTCAAGLLCSSGICVPQNNCGALNQPCCDTNPPCGVTLTCLNGTCQANTTCGDEGQPCCTGGAAPCNLGLVCTGGVCISQTGCGKSGKICCTTGNPCDSGLTCVNNTCRPSGPCGLPGQACCAEPNTCTVANTVCLSGTCHYCGFPGQACCAGNTCAASNITCCSTGNCNTVDNMCHACGLPGLPCCGGVTGTCTRASTCRSGICVPS